MYFFILITVVHVLALTYFYAVFRRSYRLWTSQSVPSLPPTFPMGNLTTATMLTNFGDVMHTIYHEFKRIGDFDYGGLFFLNKPVLLVLSPEFARIIMVRDFGSFVNRGVYFDRAGDPISANLVFIEDDEWRTLRSRITRTFTAGKIRMMFDPLHRVGVELLEYLRPLTVGGRRTMEITEFLFRFNTDVIGSCVFGIQCNTLTSAESEFREIGKKMLNFTRVRLLKMYVAMLFRREARALGFRLVDEDVSRFITAVVREAIVVRRGSSAKQSDFLQLLIDLIDDSSDEGVDRKDGRLSVDEIAANVFVFFFAGFETSTSGMTYALYELAQNPYIQEKARQEIRRVTQKYEGETMYESMSEMVYLEQVVNETMRKHPAVGTLHRISTEEYTLPNGARIPKGTYVVIPALAFHRDPELFPHPDIFDPERFSAANRHRIKPFSFLPFGEGPRICIGQKFGMLQTKFGLAMLLRHYRFSICERTKIPLEIDSVSLFHIPKGGVWLNMETISTNNI